MSDFEFSKSILWGPLSRTGAMGYRELRIFATDAVLSKARGQVTTLRVPFEPLGTQLRGQRLFVQPGNGPFNGERLDIAELDNPSIAGRAGLEPDSCDAQFAQQMVYAVSAWTLERFRRALGREPAFAFEGPLQLIPYAMQAENAYYSREEQALKFGWFNQRESMQGFNQSGTLVSTAHSHDIIVHECTHALIDGMRPHLMLPTNRDVLALHEAVADLVALFAHFTHRELLCRALAANEGSLVDEHLTGIAVQFGRSTHGRGPLRSGLLGPDDERPKYSSTISPHKRGSLLVTAVFRAFLTVYERKTRSLRDTARNVKLLSNHPLLIDLLASTASNLADHFLNIMLRALDYLPPMDVWFGELLRAMVTADRELVPDDPWHYREALVQGFRELDIPIYGVRDLSESELVWRRVPDCYEGTWLRRLADLPLQAGERRAHSLYLRRARCLARFLDQNRRNLAYFGLVSPGSLGASPIRIESVRSIRRLGPDGQLMLHFVAELVQWRQVESVGWMPGGASLIIDCDGRLRYAIRKDVTNASRADEMDRYLSGAGLQHRAIFSAASPSQVSAQAADAVVRLHLNDCIGRCG